MVERSETLASKFLASLRVPAFIDTQEHMAGKVFNHSRPTIRSFFSALSRVLADKNEEQGS